MTRSRHSVQATDAPVEVHSSVTFDDKDSKSVRKRKVATMTTMFRLASVPATRQGVKNLDLLAPKHLRNGHRFRPPQNYEAICSHDVLDPRVHTRCTTRVDRDGHEYDVEQEYQLCSDCGAEVNCE